MMAVGFINYNGMKEKYTMQEGADLIGVPVDVLWDQCVRHGIFPTMTCFGEAEISKHNLRGIHNALYYMKP